MHSTTSMKTFRFRNERVIAFDTETTGLRPEVDVPFGFSISTLSGQSGYWDVREQPKFKKWLLDELMRFKGTIVMHNASFDVRMVRHWNIDLLECDIDDTVIREYCINEHHFEYSLDHLAKIHLKKTKESDIYREMADLFGGLATRNVQMGRIKKAPSKIVAPYAIGDTDLTLELWQWQQDEIKRQGIERIVAFEKGLMKTFIRSEIRGIRVDLNAADKAISKLTPVIDKKQKQLNKLAGCEVNVNSSPQVKKLFDPMEKDDEWYTNTGHLLPKTPNGNASLGAEVLREMDDPMSRLILAIRSDIKTRDTFLASHVAGHAHGGRVYPSIHQTKGEAGGAGTGRVQYTSPAMGQIPDRDKETAAIVKPCFLPEEGHIWVDSDLSQFEVRVFFHLANIHAIIKSFNEDPNQDTHEFTGKITGLVRNATYPGQANAKQLNLSMIFNSGNGAIAEKMGMPWEWSSFEKGGKKITYKKAGREAMSVINEYHRNMPGVKELANKAKKLAENTGYVKTFTGRRLRFPKGYKAYAASGICIQATAADLNKENWRIIEEQLDGVGHMILNTHDSYSMSLPLKWREHYERVKAEIEKAGRIRIPLVLDLNGAGVNWWDSKC